MEARACVARTESKMSGSGDAAAVDRREDDGDDDYEEYEEDAGDAITATYKAKLLVFLVLMPYALGAGVRLFQGTLPPTVWGVFGSFHVWLLGMVTLIGLLVAMYVLLCARSVVMFFVRWRKLSMCILMFFVTPHLCGFAYKLAYIVSEAHQTGRDYNMSRAFPTREGLACQAVLRTIGRRDDFTPLAALLYESVCYDQTSTTGFWPSAANWRLGTPHAVRLWFCVGTLWAAMNLIPVMPRMWQRFTKGRSTVTTRRRRIPAPAPSLLVREPRRKL